MFRSSLLTVVFVVACQSDKNPTTHTEFAAAVASGPATVAAPALPTQPAPPVVQKVELEISSVGDTMTFDKTAMTVPAKSEVHLVFHNNAKLDALPHNWVLVTAGTEARIAADGLALGVEQGYTPKSDDVLAAVPLTAPKGTSEITFTAPKYAGKYPYICTVPGHYVMMKGVLTVTAP